VQPVVAVAANGGARTEVKAGDLVELEVRAEAPPAGGSIVSVEWDFEGHGAFPFRHEVTGTDTSVLLSTTHTYQDPGTYFATARVCAHRDGKVDAEIRRLPNVASARVVVS
jgi:PKD domain